VNRPEHPPNVRWTLWAAFLFSHVVLAGIGQVVGTSGEGLAPAQRQPVEIAFAAAAVGTLVFAIAVVPRLLARLESLPLMLLRFACAEAVTILGLVLALLGALPTVWLSFAAFGVLAHVLFAPTAADDRRRPLA
jgi:hypothetical protein